MSVPKKILDTIGEASRLPACRQLELNLLESKVCLLRIHLAYRSFALEYHPTEGTCVWEDAGDAPTQESHEEDFATLEPALTHFKSMLTKATHSKPERKGRAAIAPAKPPR